MANILRKVFWVTSSLTALTIIVAALMVALTSDPARADGNFPPVSDPLTQKECGVCHMAFSPSMLPQASWRKMMGDLSNHFGEDATLKADAVAQIANYLEANAGDSRWIGKNKALRGLNSGDAPLRITETPYWLRKHRPDEVPLRAWQDPRVGSKANCMACHRYADRGYYDDD